MAHFQRTKNTATSTQPEQIPTVQWSSKYSNVVMYTHVHSSIIISGVPDNRQAHSRGQGWSGLEQSIRCAGNRQHSAGAGCSGLQFRFRTGVPDDRQTISRYSGVRRSFGFKEKQTTDNMQRVSVGRVCRTDFVQVFQTTGKQSAGIQVFGGVSDLAAD
jgi:hypothetical protein